MGRNLQSGTVTKIIMEKKCIKKDRSRENKKNAVHKVDCKVANYLTLLCSALCRGQLKRKVLNTGIHMLSLSTVRYISVNSKAAGYCSINCQTQFRNSKNKGDCTRGDTEYTENAGFNK